MINAGGTFLVMAGQDVEMGTLTFKDGAGYSVSSTDIDVLKAAYEGNAQTGTVKLDKLTGLDTAVANPDYALFKTELTFDETSSILTGTLSAERSGRRLMLNAPALFSRASSVPRRLRSNRPMRLWVTISISTAAMLPSSTA